jgi:hypothetical protein
MVLIRLDFETDNTTNVSSPGGGNKRKGTRCLLAPKPHVVYFLMFCFHKVLFK